MTLLPALVLLGLVLVDDDLGALDLAEDFALNLRALNHGRADHHTVVLAQHQNFEVHRVALLGVELLDIDHVVLLNTILLTTGLNNCVHVKYLPARDKCKFEY